jgi:hypothetical protein
VSAPDAPDFDEERIIRVLDRHEVQYVLVGGLGAVFHGATRPTMDFDMCASWELANLGRLADALNELAGKLKVRDLPAHMELPKADARLLHESVVTTWRTSAGDIDILVGIPSDPYSDLERFEALRSRAERGAVIPAR